MDLRAHLGRATVVRAGRPVPLVREERLLLPSDRSPVPESPPSRLPLFLAAGLAWGAAILVLGRAAAGGAWLPRAATVVAAGGWSVLAGLAGLVLVLAWAFTDHVFWGWNENVVQVDLLSLGVAVGWAVLLFRRGLPWWTASLALVVAALSLLGLLVQVLPGFDQVNGEVLALTVPVNLAVAATARGLVWRKREAEPPAAAAA
jgi:hypothetical protein